MDSGMIMQTALWLVAGLILFVLMSRRRKRKAEQIGRASCRERV